MELAGKLLVAMTGMSDPRFANSVVLICRHSIDGAMGLIINKPLKHIAFSCLMERLNLPVTGQDPMPVVHQGGPMQTDRGFVLHPLDDTDAPDHVMVAGEFGVTATVDILENISAGLGPRQFLFALGYAGWGPNQLEQEILESVWMIATPSTELVFDTDASRKWVSALRLMGIDPISLSPIVGHA